MAAALADVNRDGRPDLLLAQTSGRLKRTTGHGTELLRLDRRRHASDRRSTPSLARRRSPSPSAIWIETACPTWWSPRPPPRAVGRLRGLGNGAFTPQRFLSLNQGSIPSAVALADLNRDGALDVIVAHANGISIFPGDGAGGFGDRIDAAVGLSPLGLAVGDVNRDGRLDLAFTSATDGIVRVMLGDRRRDLRRSLHVLRLHRAQRAWPSPTSPATACSTSSCSTAAPGRWSSVRASATAASAAATTVPAGPDPAVFAIERRQQGRPARPGRALVRSTAARAAQRRHRRGDHCLRRLPAADPGGVQRELPQRRRDAQRRHRAGHGRPDAERHGRARRRLSAGPGRRVQLAPRVVDAHLRPGGGEQAALPERGQLLRSAATRS